MAETFRGEKLAVTLRSSGQRVAGKLAQADEAGLTLELGRNGGARQIQRGDIGKIHARRVPTPAKGRIIGVAAAAAGSTTLTVLGVTIANNEGGVNSRVAGFLAGVWGGALVIGYFAGRAADFAPVEVLIPDLSR